MEIKQGDFIEVDYIGYLRDSGNVFDTTLEEEAKKAGIHSKNSVYGTKVICVGRQYILKAIDDSLIGKSESSEYELELDQENAFGKRELSLIRAFPLDEMRRQKINPFPGLQLTLGGVFGVVRSVNSGRVTIDFNNPLSGRDVKYKLKLGKIVMDNEQKLKGLINVLLNIKQEDYTLEKKDDEFILKAKAKINKEIKQEFIEEAKEVMFNLKLKFE